MAVLMLDIEVGDEWLNLNTYSGIPVGDEFSIQNKKSTWVLSYEGDTPPDLNETSGELLTNLGRSNNNKKVFTGAEAQWVKSNKIGVKGLVNIQGNTIDYDKPVITVQPQSKTVSEGDEVTFNITVTGSETIHYQWSKDGVAVGEDSSSYTFIASEDDDNTQYVCVVSNAAAVDLSDTATLTVIINTQFMWSSQFYWS